MHPAATSAVARSYRRAILAGAITVLINGPVLAQASQPATSAQTNFDIPAQPAGEALNAFARQTGLRILFPFDAVDGKRTRAIRGVMRNEAALGELLADTGLIVASRENGVITLCVGEGGKCAKKQQRDDQVGVGLVPSVPNTAGTGSSDAVAAVNDQEELTSSVPISSISPEKITTLEEIVVVGTNIRGAAPIGSPNITVNRDDIANSGYGRAQDYLESLPQNFSGSASEDNNSDRGAGNNSFGQAIDLRGLGASSTLVLVNGHRQPSGGLEGSFVDISSIPTAAIERIEILTDGSSALYGSDAVAGVVNFVLRPDYDGVETSFRYGSYGGNANETQASIVGGHNWGSGNILAVYQYSNREALMAADTFYGSLNQDFTSLGGGNGFRSVQSNPGTILNPTTFQPAFAIPAGQDGTSLTVSDLVPGANFRSLDGLGALPEQVLQSAFVGLRQDMSSDVELAVELRFSEREAQMFGGGAVATLAVPSTNPFYVNPFGGTGPVRVAYDFRRDFGAPIMDLAEVETYSATAGLTWALPSEWELRTTGSFAVEQSDFNRVNGTFPTRRTACLSGLPSSLCPGAPLNVFGDGAINDPLTLAYTRYTMHREARYELASFTAIADGPLFAIGDDTAQGALGVDYRSESLAASDANVFSDGTSSPGAFPVGNLDRQIAALFGELSLPLISGRDGPRFQVSLAGRYEDYSDFGETFNPKVGATFSATDDVDLRASWGTSFRAPRFNELSTTINPPRSVGRVNIADPASPTGFSNTLELSGNNPDLSPETAETLSVGFDLAPSAIPSLRVSASYLSIDYADKIQAGGTGSTTLLSAAVWESIITRNPSAAEVNAICTSSTFSGTCATPIGAIIDGRLRNLAQVHVDAIDFAASYEEIALLGGDLGLDFAGTYVLEYSRAVSAAAPRVDISNTVGNPLTFRGRATATWTNGGLGIFGAINYANAYDRIDSTRDVEAWTTFDFGISYRLADEAGRGTMIRLSATNALDEEAPFVDGFLGYDAANANDRGRNVSVTVMREW